MVKRSAAPAFHGPCVRVRRRSSGLSGMRLRLRHVLLGGAVSTSCVIAVAPPAIAQSFFQTLFGFGGKPSAQARPAGRSLPAYRFHYRDRRFQREGVPEDEEIGPPDSGGPYRTMCVRACDGYYFPLRHNAMRRNFAQDIRSCRSACGDEARLFYYPVNGGSVDSMVDLAGQPYKDMPNAFSYRKSLISGCACKPAPWSFEAAARHRRYAEEASELMAQAAAQARRRYEAHLQATGASDVQTPWQEEGPTGTGSEQNGTPSDQSDPQLETQEAAISSDETAASSVVIGPPLRYAVGPRRGYGQHKRSGQRRAAVRARYIKPQATASGLWGWLAKPKNR